MLWARLLYDAMRGIVRGNKMVLHLLTPPESRFGICEACVRTSRAHINKIARNQFLYHLLIAKMYLCVYFGRMCVCKRTPKRRHSIGRRSHRMWTMLFDQYSYACKYSLTTQPKRRYFHPQTKAAEGWVMKFIRPFYSSSGRAKVFHLNWPNYSVLLCDATEWVGAVIHSIRTLCMLKTYFCELDCRSKAPRRKKYTNPNHWKWNTRLERTYVRCVPFHTVLT